jgi:hypothetical protein
MGCSESSDCLHRLVVQILRAVAEGTMPWDHIGHYSRRLVVAANSQKVPHSAYWHPQTSMVVVVFPSCLPMVVCRAHLDA